VGTKRWQNGEGKWCSTTRLLMKLLLRSMTRSLLSDIRDIGSILSELSRSSSTSKLHNLQHQWIKIHTHIHTHLTALCPGPPRWAGTRKVKTNLDFTEARDSDWQWHQLGHMQVCTSLQRDNHASTPPLSFLQAGCPSTAQPIASKHWRLTVDQDDVM